MKGGFELGLIMFFGMLFVVVGFSLSMVSMSYHNARVYQEAIVSTIDRQDRYDLSVVELIDALPYNCHNCTYQVVNSIDNRYEVIVLFPIRISVLNLSIEGKVSMLTQPM